MKALKNKKVLITAGPTREYIDPVRFISNDSSGLMGLSLADAAKKMGARVTVVLGPVVVTPPKGIKIINVTSAREMFTAVKKICSSADIIVCAAAVADYTVARPARHKIKKGRSILTLKLVKTPDILSWLGKNRRKRQTLVGFALETSDLIANARKKLHTKKCDLIVANSHRAIASKKTSVILVGPGRRLKRIGPASKNTIARAIFSAILS